MFCWGFFSFFLWTSTPHPNCTCLFLYENTLLISTWTFFRKIVNLLAHGIDESKNGSHFRLSWIQGLKLCHQGFFSPRLSFLFSAVYVCIIFSIKDLPACSQEEDHQSPISQHPCLAVAMQREFLSPNFHRLILGIESNWSCYVSCPLLRPLNFQGKLSCHTTPGGNLHTEIYVSGGIWRLSRVVLHGGPAPKDRILWMDRPVSHGSPESRRAVSVFRKSKWREKWSAKINPEPTSIYHPSVRRNENSTPTLPIPSLCTRVGWVRGKHSTL